MFAAAGATAVARGVLAAAPLPRKWRGLCAAASGGALYLTGVSLLASHLVYDRSELHRWTWLDRAAPGSPGTILNIHSGFDDTSATLATRYPAASQ